MAGAVVGSNFPAANWLKRSSSFFACEITWTLLVALTTPETQSVPKISGVSFVTCVNHAQQTL